MRTLAGVILSAHTSGGVCVRGSTDGVSEVGDEGSGVQWPSGWVWGGGRGGRPEQQTPADSSSAVDLN